MITATLVFLKNLDFHARIQKFLCNSISVWECDFSSEASAAEIKPVLTKKDEFQYGDKFLLLARFDFFFGKTGFLIQAEKRPLFQAIIFPHNYEYQQNCWRNKFRLWLRICMW